MLRIANAWTRDYGTTNWQKENKFGSLTNTYAFSMIVSCFVPEKP